MSKKCYVMSEKFFAVSKKCLVTVHSTDSIDDYESIYLKLIFKLAVNDGGYSSAVNSQPNVLSIAIEMIPP